MIVSRPSSTTSKDGEEQEPKGKTAASQEREESCCEKWYGLLTHCSATLYRVPFTTQTHANGTLIALQAEGQSSAAPIEEQSEEFSSAAAPIKEQPEKLSPQTDKNWGTAAPASAQRQPTDAADELSRDVFATLQALLYVPPPADSIEEPLVIGSLDPNMTHADNITEPCIMVQAHFRGQIAHLSYYGIDLFYHFPGTFEKLAHETAGYQIHYECWPDYNAKVKRSEGAECELIDDMPDEFQKPILDKFHLTSDDVNPTLWYVSIAHPRKACGYNLFTYRDYYGPIISPIRRRLIGFLHSDTRAIEMIVQGPYVDIMMKEIMKNWGFELCNSWMKHWFQAIGKRQALFEGQNALREPGDRATHTIDYSSRPNMFKYNEAQILPGIGLRQEEEHVRSLVSKWQKVTLRIIKLGKGANEEGLPVQLQFMIEPDQQWPVQVKEDTSVLIMTDPNSRIESSHIRGKVVKSPVYASTGDTVVIATRNWDKETLCWKGLNPDGTDPIIHDLNKVVGALPARAAVQKLPKIPGKVKIDLPFQQFARVKKAMRQADKGPENKVLESQMMGNDLWTPEPYNLFNRACFKFHGDQAVWDAHLKKFFGFLNAQQRQFIDMLDRMPLRTLLLEGCAGTGKTLVLRKLAMFLAMTLAEDGTRNLVLNVFPDNANADAVCDQHYAELCALREAAGELEPIVIRLHSPIAERQIFLSEAEALRPAERNAKSVGDYFVQGPADLDMLQQSVIYLSRRTNTNRVNPQFRGVWDKRAKRRDRSLGVYCMRFLDMLDEGDPLCLNSRPYANALRRFLFKLARGETFTSAEAKHFAELRYQCVNDVLLNADEIFVTDNTFQQSVYYKPLRARKIYAIFDECSKLLKISYFGIHASLHGAIRASVPAGDRDQGKIVVQTTPKNNSMHEHYKISILQFLFDIGMSYVYLDTQHRAVTEIANMWRDLLYRPKGRDLKTDPAIEDTAEAKKATEVSKTIFKDLKNPSRLILIEIENSKQTKMGSPPSSFNKVSLTAEREIKEKLIKAGVNPEDIIQLSPYRANSDVAQNINHPSVAGIENAVEADTFAKYQGKQAGYSIVALVITDSLGFMQNAQVLLPGFTRGRFLTVLIADVNAIRSSNRYQGTLLQKLIDYMYTKGYVMSWTVGDNPDNVKAVFPSTGVEAERGTRQRILHMRSAQKCKFCGSPDHIGDECGDQNGTKFVKCTRCNAIGHKRTNCDLPWCKHCQNTDHDSKDCLAGDISKGCKRCNTVMHNVDDCPVKLKEGMETLQKETGGMIKGKNCPPTEPRPMNVIQQAAKVKMTVREEPKIPKQVPKPEVNPTTEETYTQGDEDTG